MKKIVFLRGQEPNPRYKKRLELLKNEYEAMLIYWEKTPSTSHDFHMDGIQTNIIKSQANAYNPISRMLPYLGVRKKVYDFLKKEKPNLIYAEALDIVDIACKYKRRIDPSVKIIYEVADLHRYIVDKPKSLRMKLIHDILCLIDRRNCKLVDYLVLTSEKYYDVYFKNIIEKEKMIFVPNMPDLAPLEKYKPKMHSGIKTIGFIGRIRYIEECKIMIAAARRAGWNILFAGSESGCVIKEMCNEQSDIYLGAFDFNSQIKDIYEQCDVVYSVYDSDMANVRVALPNKLYESIYCELPIIVAKHTYLQELVELYGVGIAIEHDSVEELTDVLNRLENDKDFYDKLCLNCKNHKDEINEKMYSNKLKSQINLLLND